MVGFMGTSVTSELASFIKEYKPGGVILFSRNLESVEQIVELTNDLQGCSPQSPLLISIDQEGGRVSRLPKGFTIFPPCELIGPMQFRRAGLCRWQRQRPKNLEPSAST